MLHKSLSKSAAPLLGALLMLAPAAPALAWTHVCVDMPFWHVWFAGQFKVYYGFQQWPDMPYISGGGRWETGTVNLLEGKAEMTTHTRYGAITNQHPEYKARIQTWWSPTLRAGNKHCSPIQHIQTGENLAVRFNAHGGPDDVLCKTKWKNRSTSEARHVYQKPARYPWGNKLWYRVTGSVFNPNCEFTHESW